jgi:hypothetical protein
MLLFTSAREQNVPSDKYYEFATAFLRDLSVQLPE